MVSQAYFRMPRYVLTFVDLGQLLHLGNMSFVLNDIVVASVATLG